MIAAFFFYSWFGLHQTKAGRASGRDKHVFLSVKGWIGARHFPMAHLLLTL
jgi:hypothetical protein